MNVIYQLSSSFLDKQYMNNLKDLSFTRMTQFLQRKRIVCLFSVARAYRLDCKQQAGPSGVARRVPSIT